MRKYAFYFAVAFAGITWLICTGIHLIPVVHTPVLGLPLMILGICLRQYRKWVALSICMGLLVGGLYVIEYHSVLVAPVLALDGQTQTIHAQIRSYPQIYQNNQRVEVEVYTDSVQIVYPKRKFRAIGYLPLTELALKPGDAVRVQVDFYSPDIRQGFDRQRYQMGNGNYISFSYTKDAEQQPTIFGISPCEKIPWFAWPQQIAKIWEAKILESLPQREGGFLLALLLGNRSMLDPIDAQNLQKVGLSHIIAVSGMHLTFLVALLQKLFSKRIGMVLSFFVILFFIPMAGASPSVLRAGIMTILAGIAFLFERQADAQTSLGVALMILLIANPYAIYSLSLQLSFLSTFGILYFAKGLEKRLAQILFGSFSKRPVICHGVCATMSCSLCALLLTFPILVRAFGYITLLSVPANLLGIWLVSLLFALGLFACMVPVLFGILAPILCVGIQLLLQGAAWLGTQHWGILYWNEGTGKVSIFFVFAAIIVLLTPKWSHPKITFPIFGICLTITIFYGYHLHKNTTTILLHDVGEGQMISIIDGYETISVIDCGGSANTDTPTILRETMNWYGISEVDTMLFTAVDKAHARYASSVLEEIPVLQVILPQASKNDTWMEIEQTAQRKQLPLTIWTRDGATELLLSGIEKTQVISSVARKLVVRLQVKTFDLLVTHSLTQNMLAEFLETYPIQAKRVILAHQFEKEAYWKSALDVIQPEQIYLSSGYPSVSRLNGIPVQNTADYGTIVFSIPNS